MDSSHRLVRDEFAHFGLLHSIILFFFFFFRSQGAHIPQLPVVPGAGDGNGNGEGYPSGGPNGNGNGNGNGGYPSGEPDSDRPFDPTNSNGLPVPEQQDDPNNGYDYNRPSRPQGEYLPPSNDPGVPPSNSYIPPPSNGNNRFVARNRY